MLVFFFGGVVRKNMETHNLQRRDVRSKIRKLKKKPPADGVKASLRKKNLTRLQVDRSSLGVCGGSKAAVSHHGTRKNQLDFLQI